MMKKYILGIFVFVGLLSNAFCEEHYLLKLKCKEQKDFVVDVMYVVYDDEMKQFYLKYDAFWSVNHIEFSRNNLIKLRTIIGKYFEWENTAQTNKVKVDKEIPDSTMDTEGNFDTGSQFRNPWDPENIKIKYYFFSQEITRHQLVFIVESGSIRTYYFYFDKDQIRLLYNSLLANNKNNIFNQAAAIEAQIQKNKQADSLFR